MMDIRLYTQILEIDSTSGRERGLVDFLAEKLQTGNNRVERFDVESMADDVPDGCGLPQNLLISWGSPKVFLCTHLDTVPPFIPPTFNGDDMGLGKTFQSIAAGRVRRKVIRSSDCFCSQERRQVLSVRRLSMP